MKHYDVDVKKFIKNVVSLVVSGLLLVAATIAWFTQGHTSTVSRVDASMRSTFQVSFMHHTTASTYLDNVTSSGSTTLKVRERNSSGTFTTDSPVKTYVESLQSNTWQSSDPDNNDWDLDLYPGKYGLYKFEYISNGTTKNLALEFGTLQSDMDDTMDAVEIYAWAVTVNNGTESSPIAQASMTLSDLDPASNTSSSVFTNGISANSGTSVRVYYVIGMPATNGTANYQHDVSVREENRTIAISQVYLDTVTSS